MALLRGLVVTVVLIVVVFFVLSYVNGTAWIRYPHDPRPAAVGTTGTSTPIDPTVARERGAAIGEQVAVAAEKVKDAAEDGAITSKIKAKMALDDTIKARSIDVTTPGTTVTLSGTVRSVGERERAVSLARETAGVTHVVDRLDMAR